MEEKQIKEIILNLETLSIYKNLQEDLLIKSILSAVKDTSEREHYSKFLHCLYDSESKGNLWGYVFNKILLDINPFSLAIARKEDVVPCIYNAAVNDITKLLVFANIKSCELKRIVDREDKYSYGDYVLTNSETMKASIDRIVKHYENNGVGIFSIYKGFKFQNRVISPIKNLSDITFKDFKLYFEERSKIVKNTMAFLSGFPYNNVLLYGDRGTGKSSTIKALLNELSHYGLRMIEIGKSEIVNLNFLMDEIASIPLKFIFFIDDINFNEDDDGFNILKAALEGSLNSRPDNVAIYATTNRRHIIKETFTAREGGEVHLSDTLDETMSLSDRFGLTVTFLSPDKDNYLEIVKEMIKDRKIPITDELLKNAETFSLRSGSRSPRIAKQFVDALEADMKLN